MEMILRKEEDLTTQRKTSELGLLQLKVKQHTLAVKEYIHKLQFTYLLRSFQSKTPSPVLSAFLNACWTTLSLLPSNGFCNSNYHYFTNLLWEWVTEAIQTIICFIRQWQVLMDWVIHVTVALKRKRGRGQTKQEIKP